MFTSTLPYGVQEIEVSPHLWSYELCKLLCVKPRIGKAQAAIHAENKWQKNVLAVIKG